MSVKLAIAGGAPFDVHDEQITLGSDPSCTVKFPASPYIKPKHAVIRSIAGRWLIEVREGDSIFVGGPEPRRLQWLNPGDEIRLYEQCPVVVFQPSLDAAGPGPIASRMVDKPIVKVNDDANDNIVIPLDSDPSMPSFNQPPKAANPSRGSVPSPVAKKPLSSSSIPVRKPGSSATIPVSISRMEAVPAETNDPLSALNAMLDDEQSSAKEPTRSARPTNEPTPEAPIENVPVLARISSEDGSVGGRQLTPEQQEIRWIMMVVGRAAGVGLAVLLVWLFVGWVWRLFAPQKIDSVPVSREDVEQPIAPPVVASVRPHPTRTLPDQPRVAEAPDSDATPVAMTDDAKVDAPPESKVSITQTPSQDVAVAETMKVVSEPDERAAGSSEKSVSTSPTIQAVQEGIYAVVMEDADQTRRVPLGTAWAVSRRYLVTTASILTSIEEHQQRGMIALVMHFATGKSYRIKTKKLHESYTKAAEAIEDARERKDDGRVATDLATQLRFDLGVIDLGRSVRLPHRLAFDAESLEDSKESAYVMVGLPIMEREDAITKIDADSIKERRCKKPAADEPIQDKSMGLTIQFALDKAGKNWSGSPVLNKNQKVIGIYAQLLQPKPTPGKPVKPMHGVVWIGRLNEVIPEIE